MGYHATKVEMSYENMPLLPQKDSAYIDYQKFKETFGEEGNVIVIGIQDSNLFKLENFNNWRSLSHQLRALDGVEGMVSVGNIFQLVKNSEKKKFDLREVFPDDITSQEQLDSAVTTFKTLSLYKGYLYNDSTHSFLMVLTMNKDRMKSKEREDLVKGIRKACEGFKKETGTQIHYSGLPYIRVMNTILIKKEIFLFSILALLICVVILYLFFHSFKAMLFPAIVVLFGVINAVGTMSLLGFKITLLTGMIPPLLIVIGIPNSIFMLNKYHNEYRQHGNKIKALSRVISRIGNAIFLTNLTTACGFATFIITSSDVLKQFGIVASINIIGLFVFSLLLIPIIFSFLAPPQKRHVKHLDRKGIGKIVKKLIYITLNHRKAVYITTIIVLLLSGFGISLMRTTGFMVDDIQKSDPIYIDLKFFEHNFDGIMPLEIIIDSRKPNGIISLATLKRIERLDNKLQEYDELSSSISIVNVVKMAKQAFFNGNPRYYSLPTSTEKNFILSYATQGDGKMDLAQSFIDSLKQVSRISIRMKDVGTKRMDQLYHLFNQDVKEIFPESKYDITVTGSSIVFFKGNQYLVSNLFLSLALAVSLIAVFMAFMFHSSRMVLMSLIPNVIPLMFTAALRGYAGIPLKASTILVFSIAFGISVDNTIHFLAKYRQELTQTNWNIRKSVLHALNETGVSMIYTSTVLFFGFGIFSMSNFGGTQAMGVLVSLTLFVALISNLVLLPSLLLGLDRFITTRSFHEPLLQIYDEEEDIDLDELEIKYDKNENN